MKQYFFCSFLFVLFFLSNLVAEPRTNNKTPADYVNPFIGTANSVRPSKWESNGGTYPGAATPFGMVQATPEGYRYAEPHISWFSFINHTSGYPNGSSGDFNLMPFAGEIKKDRKEFGSKIFHEKESAQPGYYSVLLQESKINCEFTVTPHAGFCRFEFHHVENAKILFSDFSEIKVTGQNTISGKRGEWHFYGEINQPVHDSNLLDNLFFVEIPSSKNHPVLLKIGFSKTSASQAKKNLLAEIPDWDFDATKDQAFKSWNDQLSRFKIKGGTAEQKEIFYTSVYHSLLDPHLESDMGEEPRYSQLSPWDTFRSKHPLLTLLWPEQQLNMIKSVLDRYKQTGQLPTGPMTGNHNIPVIVDSYFKGITDFDVESAYKAMRKALLEPPYGRPDIGIYDEYGYVPAEQSYSVTKTLEYAYNDWALAELARELGKTNDAEILKKRALSYQQIFNPQTKFMGAKTKAGEWAEEGFREGDQWTYSWFVPHDVQGLMNLMGGNEQFADKLKFCFVDDQYVHDNEPPLHYAYLFNYAGAPWLTQKWVEAVRQINYTTDPGGLPGNDDLGALSAWYVLSAMGTYPVCPGRPIYDLGVPLFKELDIQLPNGKSLTILAKNKSDENKYVSAVSLNGKKLNRLWIQHEELMRGGKLVFEMSSQPNQNPELQAAKSMTMGKSEFEVKNFTLDKTKVRAHETFVANTTIQNNGDAPGTFDFPIYVDGKEHKTESVIVDAGKERIVKSEVKLYEPDKHTIQISPKFKQTVFVEATKPIFIFSDFQMPNPPVVQKEKVLNFSATVQNIGSYKDAASVILKIDDSEMELGELLEPGQKDTVQFDFLFTKTGLFNVSIGNLGPKKLRVVEPGEIPESLYKAQQFDPVVLLGFDEENSKQISDFSGNGNNANAVNNVKWVPGIYGQAIQTSAMDLDYVEIPNSESMKQIANSKTLSMMAWIYPMEEKNFADFFTQGDWNVMQLRASNTAVNFYSGGYQRGEAYGTVDENWNRNWHHVAGVTQGNLQKLYVDGKLIAEKEIEILGTDGSPNPIGNVNIPWNIGRNAQNPERFFNGYIDDARIYLKPVPQDEIKKIMLNDNYGFKFQKTNIK
jgi:putative alpha-1,2-mannosidase